MHISEIENDQIKVSRIKMKTDNMMADLEKPLQPFHFFYLMVAPPGAGKTSMILNLLTKRGKAYNRRFDKVYIWSPSLRTLEKPLDLPEDQVFDEFDMEDIDEILTAEKDTDHRILFIFDDMVANLKRNLKPFLKLVYNRRHYGGGISIMVTTQVLNKVPMEIRKVATALFFWMTRNKAELKTLFEEFIQLPKDQFDQVVSFSLKSRHDFLFVDLTVDPYDGLYRNFNRLIIE